MVNGTISDCINVGKIYAKINTALTINTVCVGGLIGYIDGTATLQRCYNVGDVSLDIEGTQPSYGLYVGGCVGNISASITDCYNIGTVSVTADYSVGKGAVGGILRDNGTASNVYYLERDGISGFGNVSDSEGMVKTETEMKTTEFINLLNTNTAGAFKKDTNNINNGYPILSWQ